MTRIISALLVAISSAAFATSVWAEAAKPLQLAPDAPEQYTVAPGDTLWSISAKFITDPYRWPELWRLNEEQVKNPHRIYPGQVLVLNKASGEPMLTVRVEPKQYATPLSKEIPAIPQGVIEPFLAKPLVVEANALDTAPRIVGLEENRLLVATGSKIYVTGITDPRVQTYQIYRPGKALADPVSKEILGYEAIYLGIAKLSRKGDPATLQVSSAVGEIGRGDHLVPLPKVDVVSYVPRAPKQAIDGRVVSIYGAVRDGGLHSVITLSRGKKDGLENGHVLALSLAGAKVADNFKGKKQEFQLPDERYGLVFIFRTFDRLAYGLVMEASHEVTIGDTARTP